MANFRDLSKLNYHPSGNIERLPTCEELNVGSLQRIADATELMASKYIQMEKDLKWYKEINEERRNRISELLKRNAALKGHITRLKKRLKIHNAFNLKYNPQSEDVKQK